MTGFPEWLSFTLIGVICAFYTFLVSCYYFCDDEDDFIEFLLQIFLFSSFSFSTCLSLNTSLTIACTKYNLFYIDTYMFITEWGFFSMVYSYHTPVTVRTLGGTEGGDLGGRVPGSHHAGRAPGNTYEGQCLFVVMVTEF